MPSQNKRINLTVPDNIYQQIQQYKEENALMNDATACLQLVIKQLRAQEAEKQFYQTIKKFSTEELQEIAAKGMEAISNYPDIMSKL